MFGKRHCNFKDGATWECGRLSLKGALETETETETEDALQ